MQIAGYLYTTLPRFWWTILFMLACYLAYEQGMRTWSKEYAMLRKHYLELDDDKQKLLSIQEDLLLQINSQSDPAWVELILIKGLGLVPEGQTKVYFEQHR
ncbi:MAG: hypothetical protein LLG04_07790 [Parachlamydia sp.]|nr:hypothetical protein [Parachlamydia sp.]